MTELIVALDAPLDRAVELYRALRQTGCAFKVGVPMLLEKHGWFLARDVALDGLRLMLDLKAYDTRDTILRTMEAAHRLGAHMVTVHEDCVVHTMGFGAPMAVLAVRSLTDGTGQRPAAVAMADGIVCSVQQARFIRPHTDKLLVCPGIRPVGWALDNHMAHTTPTEAARAGADYIVVGRPIINAGDPLAATMAIIDDLRMPALVSRAVS